MKAIMIGAVSVAATGLLMGACTRTHEVRILEPAPAIVGATPGSTQTTIRSTGRAPVVIESEQERDIIVKVD
ncbi:MAG: hypothetical protein AB7E79_07375 [Rhodospirillaceae bacterium]